MTRSLLSLLMIVFTSQLPVVAGMAQPFDGNPPPRCYIVEKLKTHDIVFMGTTHKQPRILQFIGTLLPHLHRAGVTHVALEIASDQQNCIQHFLNGGTGLDSVKLHAAIDCTHYRHLLQSMREIPEAIRPQILGVDLPADQYGGPISRDQWIARELSAITRNRRDAKVLVIIGALHVLRKLEWDSPRQRDHGAIRTQLQALQPGLALFSVVNLVSTIESDCDFSRAYGHKTSIQALDLTPRFRSWRLGFTRWLAIRPTPPHELVDGLIVY